VDDLIDGIMAMMNHSDDEFIGPVNLGNPNEFTMWDLAKKVLELTGSSAEVIQMPLPQDDPKQRQPNISLAKSMLNWEPTIQLEEGLLKTIEYFQKNI